jgi:hypothetical protein
MSIAPLPKIALDESGNSGQDLLYPDKPVFALASVRFSPAQIEEAEEHFSDINSREWKFAKVKKSPRQLALFLDFAEKPWVNQETVQVYLTHKKYFAVTKFVDLLYEPLARAMGHDLYEQGAALAMANLLVTTLPIDLGEEEFDKLIASFVNVVRKRDEAALSAFQDACDRAYGILEEKGRNKPFNVLQSAVLSASQPELWLEYVSDTEIDPFVPSYFSILQHWSQALGTEFTVSSDQSKALAEHLEVLDALSNPDLARVRLPSVGGGWVEFPYRSSQIAEIDSVTDRAVQLADLFAGAAFSVFGARAEHKTLSPWQERFKSIFFQKHLLLGGYWPSAEVTPEELGAEHVTGRKVVDYVSDLLR